MVQRRKEKDPEGEYYQVLPESFNSSTTGIPVKSDENRVSTSVYNRCKGTTTSSGVYGEFGPRKLIVVVNGSVSGPPTLKWDGQTVQVQVSTSCRIKSSSGLPYWFRLGDKDHQWGPGSRLKKFFRVHQETTCSLFIMTLGWHMWTVWPRRESYEVEMSNMVKARGLGSGSTKGSPVLSKLPKVAHD